MIEPSIPSKASAVESVLYGAGKGEKASGSPGFSEALSDAGQKNADAADDGAEEHVAADDLPVSQDVDGADIETQQARPVIDLKTSSLRGSTALQRGAAAALSLFNSARLQTQAEVPGEDVGEQTAAVEQSGEMVVPETGRKAGKADAAKLAAQIEKIEKIEKPKVEKSEDAELAVEAPTTEQSDASTGAVDEVLNLLVAGSDELAGATTVSPRGKAAALTESTAKAAPDDNRKVSAAAEARDALDVDALPTGEAEDAVEVPEAVEAEGGPAFRAVRADGKGQPMALRAGASGAEAVQPSTGEATQTVSVLDARRFIAPVSTSNAANIAAAMSGDREWVSAMQPGSELANAATQSSAGKVVNTLKIQMSPVDLGSVTATMRLTGETLTVQLTVESSAAYRKLNEDQNEIVKTLRSQGYAIDSVQISIAGGDRAANDGGQASQQQSNQQAAQGGNQQGAGGGGRDGSSSFGSAFNSQGTTGDDTTAANAVSGGTAGTRTGDVYL